MDRSKMSAEDKLSEAMSLVRDAYWQHVRDIAAEVATMARSGEWGYGGDAREKLQEYLWQTVDGDAWVVYTAQAQAVCFVSDNDGAYVDNYGADGLVENGSVNWSRMAYAAMEADIYEHLDIDLNDPASWQDDDAE